MIFVLMLAGILNFIGLMLFFARQSQLFDEVRDLKLDLDNIREWLKMPAKNGG